MDLGNYLDYVFEILEMFDGQLSILLERIDYLIALTVVLIVFCGFNLGVCLILLDERALYGEFKRELRKLKGEKNE